MEPDEESKDARIGLIAALKDLLKVYEMERSNAELEVLAAERAIKVGRTKLRVLEASAAIARLRMFKLGARDAGKS
jgi:hypothetical protein